MGACQSTDMFVAAWTLGLGLALFHFSHHTWTTAAVVDRLTAQCGAAVYPSFLNDSTQMILTHATDTQHAQPRLDGAFATARA